MSSLRTAAPDTNSAQAGADRAFQNGLVWRSLVTLLVKATAEIVHDREERIDTRH